jgi:hypothetical protein
MITVRICYGDEFTTECGYYYVATEGGPVNSDLFTSEEACRTYATCLGYKIDETFDFFGRKKTKQRTCKSCKGPLSWTPSGHCCLDTNCREFRDDGTTC